MPRISEPLKNRAQTGKKMKWLIKNYWRDLDEFGLLDKPLKDVYKKVRAIPYKEDKKDEIIGRPKTLLKDFKALDCKKKAIIIGSWLEAHGMPWRLTATSERPDKGIHHVFPETKLKGHWVPVDATYPEYELFEPKPQTTHAEVL